MSCSLTWQSGVSRTDSRTMEADRLDMLQAVSRITHQLYTGRSISCSTKMEEAAREFAINLLSATHEAKRLYTVHVPGGVFHTACQLLLLDCVEGKAIVIELPACLSPPPVGPSDILESVRLNCHEFDDSQAFCNILCMPEDHGLVAQLWKCSAMAFCIEMMPNWQPEDVPRKLQDRVTSYHHPIAASLIVQPGQKYDFSTTLCCSVVIQLLKPLTPHEPDVCASCGVRSTTRLRVCGKCGGAWYCDAVCQRAHWGQAHREECGSIGIHTGVGVVTRGWSSLWSWK